MTSRSAIRPGPVGFQFSICCVIAPEAGISCPAKRASQPKCASAGLDDHRNLQPAGVCLNDGLHRHTLLSDRVVNCAGLRFLEGQTIQSRYHAIGAAISARTSIP